MMERCSRAVHSYRGPLIAIAVGVGFVLVGAVPVAVTFATNTRSSATIIGVGFIGFGLLLVLPGLGWCIVRRTVTLRCCRSKREHLRPDDELAAEDDVTPPPVIAASKTTGFTNRLPEYCKGAATSCYILTDDDDCGSKTSVRFNIEEHNLASEPNDDDILNPGDQVQLHNTDVITER